MCEQFECFEPFGTVQFEQLKQFEVQTLNSFEASEQHSSATCCELHVLPGKDDEQRLINTA